MGVAGSSLAEDTSTGFTVTGSMAEDFTEVAVDFTVAAVDFTVAADTGRLRVSI